MKKLKIAGVVLFVLAIAAVGVWMWQTKEPYYPDEVKASVQNDETKLVNEPTTKNQAGTASGSKTIAQNNKTTVKNNKATNTKKPKKKVKKKTAFTIKMHFVGDLLCATDARTYYANCFEDVAKSKKPSYFLKKVSKFFKNDDYTIGDAENVYSNKKLPISDKGQVANPGIKAFWFKTKAKNARILKAGGIDYVSIENNHIMDYGMTGKTDTRKAIKKAGVVWGDEGHIRYFSKKGFKVAIIAVSMYYDGVVPQIRKYIKKASKKSDYQIIYFHGGTEAIHEPEGWKKNACRRLIDYGADLVIGDHPHVLQPMEKYKGKTIIYSMGNFVFGGNRHPENRTIIYRHTLTIDKDKVKKQKGKIIPCYVYRGAMNNWQPAVIKNKTKKKHVIQFMKKKRSSPF